MAVSKITKSPTPIELVKKVNELVDEVVIASSIKEFVVSATAPVELNVLWINTANRTLNYYDGTKWNTVVGTYG